MAVLKGIAFGAIGLAWAAATTLGFGKLYQFSADPGALEKTPWQYPLPKDPLDASWRLIFFAHPHCSCTRASAAELERVLAQTQNKDLRTDVYFIKPSGVEEDWTATDLWQKAKALPGAAVQEDVEGKFAEIFRAKTSGLILLYDPSGRLKFQGGITASRGHEGDNVGKRALLQALDGEAGPIEMPSVFGCPLSGSEETIEEELGA